MNSAVIAMSGGVDSSVSAFLLQQAGYETRGVMFSMCGAFRTEDGMQQQKDIADARAVAESLQIPFEVLDLSDAFRQRVMQFFAGSYIRGETPNPCVECNRTVKFPYLVQYADETGGGIIATGHYARTQRDPGTGRTLLLKARAAAKDQSYVLYNLPQQTLSRLVFPLGEYEKSQVRAIAEEHRLLNFRKSDSQDICFIPDGDYARFISDFSSYDSAPGDFVSEDGMVLGRHRGLIHYTTGQRRGLGVSADRPLYVLRKDLQRNQVVLGGSSALFAKSVRVAQTHYIPFDRLTGPLRVQAKIRYSQQTAPAVLEPTGDREAALIFDEPQRAPTAGQSAVFYDGNVVIGGGVIVCT